MFFFCRELYLGSEEEEFPLTFGNYSGDAGCFKFKVTIFLLINTNYILLKSSRISKNRKL